jgi:HK97 family phage major capsid protein
MSMKNALNKKLQDIAAKMADLESKSDKNEASGADIDAYKALVAEGTKTRADLTAIEDADALKAWMSESDGASAFKKSLSQEVTSPEDREQEQRAQDAAIKSAYSGAFEGYLMRGSKVGPNDRQILEKGAIKASQSKDPMAVKVLTEAVAQGGGYLVPEQYMAEVLKKEPGLTGLVDIVRHQPTSRDVIMWPIIRYSTSNAYTAPHRLTWTGEVPAAATTARVTDQTFGEVRIPVNVAMASQLISNSLVEDSAADVMQLTAQLFRENIMQDVEFYIAQGSGAGQPEGVFVNGLARANCTTSGAANGITTATFVSNLYWQLPAQYRKNAKFVMSSPSAQNISNLQDGNGRFIWQAGDMFGGGLGSAQQDGSVVINPKLLGMPLVISEQCPAFAANGFPIAFGDFKGYIMAERIGMTIRVLDELYAETDQKLYLLRYRFGGQLAEDYRVRLMRIQA